MNEIKDESRSSKKSAHFQQILLNQNNDLKQESDAKEASLVELIKTKQEARDNFDILNSD